ncbi:MAG: DUF4340 domain-containing protein [Candidatus Binataceae bacterium]
MSSRHAIIFTVLIAVLLPYYLYVDQRGELPHAPVLREATLLNVNEVNAITLIRGTEKLRYEKSGDGKLFRVADPPNGFIPQDLMQALATGLTGLKDVEIVADNPSDLAEFGLQDPQAELVIETPDSKKSIRILFGAQNPPRTAVYARIEGNPKIFLFGRNLDYYQNLMFQWIQGKQGKHA